jgi:hypothetical protein
MKIRRNIELSNLLYLQTTCCERTRISVELSKIVINRKILLYLTKHILNASVLTLIGTSGELL